MTHRCTHPTNLSVQHCVLSCITRLAWVWKEIDPVCGLRPSEVLVIVVWIWVRKCRATGKWSQKSGTQRSKLSIRPRALKRGFFILMCCKYPVWESTHLWWEHPLTQDKKWRHTHILEHTKTHTHSLPSLAEYSSSSMTLASPKSAILQSRLSDTRTLAALRSLWI